MQDFVKEGLQKRLKLEKSGCKKNLKRTSATKEQRLRGKSLETLSAQAARKWMARQEETQEQREARHNQD